MVSLFAVWVLFVIVLATKKTILAGESLAFQGITVALIFSAGVTWLLGVLAGKTLQNSMENVEMERLVSEMVNVQFRFTYPDGNDKYELLQDGNHRKQHTAQTT